MVLNNMKTKIRAWIELLRWDKPTGRLILIWPAAWALWLAPIAPPTPSIFMMVVLGGLAVSAAGCIANDLWDRHIDPLVERTRERPLANNRISNSAAIILLIFALCCALEIVLCLPTQVRSLSITLASFAIIPILLYPSAKRWLVLPQIVLAFCWGFAVLIPWGMITGNISTDFTLWGCWLSTLLWTFGFDTAYAMSDRRDDAAIGIKSSALTFGRYVGLIVGACYGLAGIIIAIIANSQELNGGFWLFWGVTFGIMIKEAISLDCNERPRYFYSQHFTRQANLGGLILLALLIGRAT
ncbi:probable 4-hydroxybenzoate-octaprenyltransferase (chromatophore) [Paulinella micropora]|uniref:4-hydroxybenzoate polyprenyltransferase, mitochondrial n=1 Tax=Paulinella micropora TaxID=1928728 RepID=A0A1L5YCS3_9EUKA|nr:putative 4-hydroxybenzoate- octaprenyltransferase [Paulinella micropora]AQX45268.1 putative 4-hydroxybenzoate- octaprenyltransferase [Paulinella micropora]BBL86486.1 probable 4-hydroxybenzoate-octaprenyltransferase [Paulinella micropora]